MHLVSTSTNFPYRNARELLSRMEVKIIVDRAPAEFNTNRSHTPRDTVQIHFDNACSYLREATNTRFLMRFIVEHL